MNKERIIKIKWLVSRQCNAKEDFRKNIFVLSCFVTNCLVRSIVANYGWDELIRVV